MSMSDVLRLRTFFSPMRASQRPWRFSTSKNLS